jgi:hypothetical protein
MVISGMEQLSRCFLGAGLRPAWRERTSQWSEFANRRAGLTGWVLFTARLVPQLWAG